MGANKIIVVNLRHDQVRWLKNHIDKNHNKSNLVRCAIDLFIEKYGSTLKIKK